jgi:serine/threonine-protein kinase
MERTGDIITLAGGHYRLREKLAGSSYGVLWRADGPGALGAVALKLINRERMARADARQRDRWLRSAQAEADFLRSLAPWDLRHIVRLLDSGEREGLPALALELLDGDLGRHLKAARAAGHQILFDQTLDWIAQINQALAKVHQHGWRYLDLKPANLLIDASQNRLKLADFGTNRPLADLAAHSYAGTPNWQAPEQFFPDAHGYSTDERTDYFALGALFYYLVSGQPLRFCSACGAAFRAHGDAAGAALLAQHGGAGPCPLSADEEMLFTQRLAGPADACRAALALLRALLARQREERPRHALEISRMILRIREALPEHGRALRSAA